MAGAGNAFRDAAERAVKDATMKGVNRSSKYLAGKTWKNFGKTAWGGITSGLKAEGGVDALVGNAVTGAMWGGGIGGTLEMAQGGSFWDGAKTGAFRGAAIGAGGTMVGNAARGFNPNASGIRGTSGTISKQLKAVLVNKQNLRNVKTK